MPRAELLPPHMPSVGTAIPCLVAVVTRQPGVPQLQPVTSPPVLLARSKEGHQPPRGGTCCPQSALVGSRGGWGRGDEGPLGAGRRLVLKSRCGAGLPAHSPVTAGEEAAPAPCGGEVTLEALVLGSRHDAGVPRASREQMPGAEKTALGVAFLHSEASSGLCGLSSSVCSGERAKGGNGDKHRAPNCSAPVESAAGPLSVGSKRAFFHPAAFLQVATSSPCSTWSLGPSASSTSISCWFPLRPRWQPGRCRDGAGFVPKSSRWHIPCCGFLEQRGLWLRS